MKVVEGCCELGSNNGAMKKIVLIFRRHIHLTLRKIRRRKRIMIDP